MDLPPLFAALGARVTIMGPHGAKRELKVENLYAGYYETNLKAGELISDVILPAGAKRRAVYLKCTTRSRDDWPALGLAIMLEVEGERVRDARIVIGAGADKVTRLVQCEAALRGATVGDALIERVSEAALDEVSVSADVRGSIHYKQELLRVYMRRGIRMAIEDGGSP
jgi:carbon-monoxide dehydrogenase medium subunit